MGNFCTNCGAKIKKEDNFCTNCGTKIDKSDMKQNNHSESAPHTMEKQKAKKELKRVVGGKLLYNENFIKKLSINSLDVITGLYIRQQVEKEIDSGQIKSDEVESRVNQLILEYKNKKEEEKAIQEQRKTKIPQEKEMRSKKIKETERTNGGYCNLSCRYCYEEFLDSGGGIVGDFDSEGYSEYYCQLKHSIIFGRFCEDYK